MTAIGLLPAQLAAAFPFHFVLDGHLRIVQTGPAWDRLSDVVRPGAAIADCFTLSRSGRKLTAKTVREIGETLVILECRSNGLPLRGQFLADESSHTLTFIGGPWIHQLKDLEKFGLSMQDWAPHQTAGDLLFLLQSKETSLAEATALSRRLSAQSADLRAAAREREEAQTLAAARETTLRAVLDTAAEGIVTIDEHGIIQSFNAAASRVFGWPEVEVIGSNVSLLIPPPDRDAHDGYISRYMATGVKSIIGRGREVEGLRRDGTRFPLYLAVSEVRGPLGRSFTGILRDLTELKQAQRKLEEAEARTRLVIDTALDAVIAIDRDGRITLWNTQAETIFGWSRDEALGCMLGELIVPPGLREAHRTGLQRYLATGEARVLNRRIEITAAHRDGHEFPVELAITPIREGGDLSFSAFVRDISDRHRSERRLRAQYEVASILATETDTSVAVPRLLETTCRILGWDVSTLWLVVPRTQTIRCESCWHVPDIEAEAFVGESRARELKLGIGLPGIVWATQRATWLPEAGDDPYFLRAASAAAAGLRSGVALPVSVAGQVVGVIEFFSRETRRQPQDVVETLTGLSNQIGTFIEQCHAQDALKRNEGRLRSLTDNMLEGLVVLDGKNQVVQANPAFARMFGYATETLIGLPVSSLLPDRPEYRDGNALADLLGRATGMVTELNGRRKSGEPFPLQAQIYEVETPDGTFLAAHVKDLSQEQEAERLKKRFVASVSHELRTPLTAIRGSLGLLAKGAVGDLPADAQDVVLMAERNAVRLVGIINDLLDFERIQTGLLSITRALFPMDRAVERAAESVQELARQSGIAVGASPSGLSVWGDEDRIVQVLVNLLGNAIKFSPAGSPVDVIVSGHGEYAEVRVRDRGRGVPEDMREIIFQPFRQADESDARHHGGSGMGLAICRAIVAQHGGRMGVESQEDAETTFWFTIPGRRVPRPATAGDHS